MTDVKRLLDEATPLPWIRPWASLEVHAPGADDLFGRLVPSIHHPGSPRAQANIDLAVYAVNHLPDYEAAVDLLEPVLTYLDRFVDVDEAMRDGFDVTMWCEAAADALRRLRGDS